MKIHCQNKSCLLEANGHCHAAHVSITPQARCRNYILQLQARLAKGQKLKPSEFALLPLKVRRVYMKKEVKEVREK